jgi:PAS domain S-box-containing protein
VDVDHIIGDAIVSAQSDAIIAADKEGTIIFWNPGAKRIFGFARAEAIGRSLDIIIPTRLRKRHWDGYRRVMESGESRYGQGDVLAVPGTAKDGRQISLEFTIVPLRDGSGELVGLAAIMRDVTERFEETRALKRKLAEMTR